MANQTWPASLPQKLLLSGFSEQPPDTRIRGEMDQGPPKMRRRSTASSRPINGEIHCTASQVETLDDFYNDTVDGGTLRFDWEHPRTGSAVEMRFRERPSYSEAISNDLYRVRLRLEIMP